MYELNDHNFICALNKIPKNCIFVLEDIDALYIDRNKKEENRVKAIISAQNGKKIKPKVLTFEEKLQRKKEREKEKQKK